MLVGSDPIHQLVDRVGNSGPGIVQPPECRCAEALTHTIDGGCNVAPEPTRVVVPPYRALPTRTRCRGRHTRSERRSSCRSPAGPRPASRQRPRRRPARDPADAVPPSRCAPGEPTASPPPAAARSPGQGSPLGHPHSTRSPRTATSRKATPASQCRGTRCPKSVPIKHLYRLWQRGRTRPRKIKNLLVLRSSAEHRPFDAARRFRIGRRIIRNAVKSPSRPAKIGISSAICSERCRASRVDAGGSPPGSPSAAPASCCSSCVLLMNSASCSSTFATCCCWAGGSTVLDSAMLREGDRERSPAGSPRRTRGRTTARTSPPAELTPAASLTRSSDDRRQGVVVELGDEKPEAGSRR